MTTTLLRDALIALAPGTDLREGLERILRGRTGAIVVLGFGPIVEALCSGGFELDVDFSPSRLRELAKMDGAVVVERDLSRIRRANVQLVPDPTLPTTETGMRHRTAQRVSMETGVPVVSVSQSMNTIAVYVEGYRHVLESSEVLLAKANQALSTLERYRTRVSEVLDSLTALELEDLVTAREVAQAFQRIEMINRVWEEIDGYVVDLGTDGRLVQGQLVELVAGIAHNRDLLLEDYSTQDREEAIGRLAAMDARQLANPNEVARALRLPLGVQGLDTPMLPLGHRVLNHIPRLPRSVANAIVEHFGTLRAILESSPEELQEVEGVGPLRGRAIVEGLGRLGESLMPNRGF